MAEPRHVEVHCGHPALRCESEEISRCLQLLDQWRPAAVAPGELSVALLTDDALAALHRAFLDDPSTTDVITFPPEETDTGEFAGEICLSVDTAARAAVKHGCPFPEELALYLVHGWLHLSGLGDKTDSDAATMRVAEAEAIAWLQRHHGIPKATLKKPGA